MFVTDSDPHALGRLTPPIFFWGGAPAKNMQDHTGAGDGKGTSGTSMAGKGKAPAGPVCLVLAPMGPPKWGGAMGPSGAAQHSAPENGAQPTGQPGSRRPPALP